MALDRALLDTQGAQLDFDMAKKEFQAANIAAFLRKTMAWDLTDKKVVLGRKSDEFIKTWKLDSEEHEPGAEIAGQTLDKTPLTVTLEDKEYISFANETNVDKFISHWDHVGEIAVQGGIAIAARANSHVLQTVIAGARTSADGNFPGGQTLTTARGGADLAEAYPVSLEGSKYLQNDMAEIAQKMYEDDVPMDSVLHCFVGPYLHRVLRQDDTLLSTDYKTGPLSNKLNAQLLKVENMWIIISNNVPSTDLSGETGPLILGSLAGYMLDFSLTAAVIIGPQAVATVHTGGITPTAYEIPNRRIVQIGSSILKGHSPFRLETCGEITIDGT